jgi:hypothetical protein
MHYAMKMYGGMDVYNHVFLTSALVGGERSISCAYHFTPWETAPGTYWIGGWVGPRAGLDLEKWKFLTLPGLQLRSLIRPARSKLLYRLHYRGSTEWLVWMHDYKQEKMLKKAAMME